MLSENINLRAKPVLRSRSDIESLDFTLMDLMHSRRGNAEDFVRGVFFNAYRARLDAFYPLLVSIAYPDGEYAAVAGVRPAGGEALFSEHYLDEPVEKILNVERQKIVEIGNLAPASAGQARWLICTLTAFLTGAGFTHVVFTGVPRLKNAFRRMGLPLTKHADARQEQLPEHQATEWGTYYESKPAVFSGDIRIGHSAFSNIKETAPDLYIISRLAYDAGRMFAGSR